VTDEDVASLLNARIDDLLARASFADWGVRIDREANCIVDHNSDAVFSTASMGKVFLLLAAARMIHAGDLTPDQQVSPSGEDLVRDSGLWQFFPSQPLSIEAACNLIAAVSDNTATNVILREIGLPDVQGVSTQLLMPDSLMLDSIRDVRESHHPDAPSRGRAIDLARLMHHLAATYTSEAADGMVASWLMRNCDLSMVASGFDLDPLAHPQLEDGSWFFNKTGTDIGVRVDAGAFGSSRQHYSYSVLANWRDDTTENLADVLRTMNAIGRLLRTTFEY
jgi:beta-lactamase class A